MDIERRAAFELRAVDGGRKVVGYASVFDSAADLGLFQEIVKPGAFSRSLASNSSDPMALFHHDPSLVLGRRSAGTLALAEDGRGLRYEIQLPNTTLGRDLGELIGRGDIRGASIGFRVAEGGESWSVDGATAMRSLTDLELFEISLTAIPAFADTSAALRSFRARCVAPRNLGRVQRWLETCE
jgi:uncharacterized protein